MEFEKRYRLDLNKWETKMVFNKIRYFFKYEIFGKPILITRKKIKGNKRTYFDLETNLKAQLPSAEYQKALYSMGGFGFNIYNKKNGKEITYKKLELPAS